MEPTFAEELAEMIRVDKEHLAEAVARGDRAIAHRMVDSIINYQRTLEDEQKS